MPGKCITEMKLLDDEWMSLTYKKVDSNTYREAIHNWQFMNGSIYAEQITSY